MCINSRLWKSLVCMLRKQKRGGREQDGDGDNSGRYREGGLVGQIMAMWGGVGHMIGFKNPNEVQMAGPPFAPEGLRNKG